MKTIINRITILLITLLFTACNFNVVYDENGVKKSDIYTDKITEQVILNLVFMPDDSDVIAGCQGDDAAVKGEWNFTTHSCDCVGENKQKQSTFIP